ncbi:MAG TPA: Ig-like domain-containing protein [Verrucomicrobiae bacterium]|nr:Ig-like domain-containing protein [Verrucomicrobiae bacterium]
MKSLNRFIFVVALTSLLTAQAAIIPAPDDQEEPSVAANGNGYFVVWADKRTYSSTEYDIFGARVSATGEVLDPTGIPICTDPGRQTSPRVAFDGERYLVVWEDDRESTSAYLLYQIFGARVTTSGQVLDPNGFKITTNRVTRLGPAVASDGHGFFVAWGDWHRADGAIEDVYGSPVSSDGVVANPDGIPLVTGAGWQGQPRLAFANGEYLMTYRDSWHAGPDIWGIRVSTSGQPLSPAFRISNSGQESGGRYGLASNGRDCFVVWGDHRGSPSGFGYPKIYGTLVRSNGVVVSPNGTPIATGALYQDRPRVASDGNGFLVVWQESNDAHEEFTDVYAAKLTGDGTVGTPARIAVNRAPGVQRHPDVAFSGANYLVAWEDGRSSPNQSYPLGALDIDGTLLSGAGAVSNADGILISGDNDAPAPPLVSLELVDADAAETLITQNNIDWAEFRVRRTGPVTSDLLVSLNTQQGSARLGEDYSLDGANNGFAVRIPAGAISVNVRLYPIDDAVYEGDETVFAHLVPPPPMGVPPYQIDFAHSSVAMVIHDNDPVTTLPLVRLETLPLQDAQALEFCPPNALCAYPSFVVRRSGPTNAELRVYLSYSGTATAGADYPSLPNSLVIPAGRDTASLMLVPTDDTLVEGPETVIARFTPVPGPGYIPDPEHMNATITIIDNERPLDTVVSIGVDDDVASETSILTVIDPARFRISRSGDLSRDELVFFSVHGSATPGTDYQELNSSIRIPAGERSVAFEIIPRFDQIAEGMETVLLRLEPSPLAGPLPSYDIFPGGRDAVAIVLDNGSFPTPGIEIIRPEEGDRFSPGASIELVAAAYHPTRDILRVDFHAGATKIGDSMIIFEKPFSGGLIVHRFTWSNPPAGVHSLTARGFNENQEHVLTSAPVQITIGTQPTQPVVGITATQRIAEESSEPFRRMNLIGEFTISRTGPTNQSLSLFVQYSGMATPGVDYPPLPRLATIPAGASSTVIRVEAINEHVSEGIETLVATLAHCGPGIDPATGILCIDGFGIDPAHQSDTVFIRDDGLTEASLVITRPGDGAGFPPGQTILIEATAIDLEGYINQIEFRDGDQRIGESAIEFIRAPDPGSPIFHMFEWRGAAAGPHTLTARTTRADGTSLQSQPVRITVGSEPPGDRELHVIGVYSGTGPDGGPSRNNERGDVSLTVNRPGKRVTLFLSAYEPVLWHVTVGEGTIVEKVILGGYYRQQVEGLPAGVELVPSYSEGGTGNYLYIGYTIESSQFYRTVPKLCAQTGLNISSFQGRYQATHPTPFVIDRVQDDPRLRCDYPEPVPPDELPGLSFRLSFYGGTGSGVFFQNYTLGGPQNGTRLLPDMRVVADNGGRFYYGTEGQSVFKADSQTGAAQEMAQPPDLAREGWPMGVAFDTARQRVLVVSLGGEGFLHAWSPAQNNWNLVASMNNLDLDCLEYHAAGNALYGISVTWGDYGGPLLYEFSAEGALRRQISLPVQPFGIGPSGYRSELVSVGDYLVLLLEANPAFGGGDHQESRMYLIDPRSGQFWLTYRKVGLTPNRPPVVSIVTPTDGARFDTGATIELGARVTDPDGNLGPMTKVEFYANGTKVGEAPGPTTAPIGWVFAWTNVTAGEYTLTARAADVLGATATSPPVHITVGQSRPVVRIEATSRIAEESSDPFARPSLVGEFKVSRTGPTTWPLPVFVQYSGTATPGADCRELPFLVTIPEGSASTTIQVLPIDDGVPEGIETVVAKISNCPPPGLLMPCIDFDIDPAHQNATVFIRDLGNIEAGLTITSPKDAAVFEFGDIIPVEATAIDLNGYISRVEFWDGEQKIGVSELIFVRPPDPGTPIQHYFEWRGAAAGSHLLTARVPRSDGTMLRSLPVDFGVRPGEPTDNQLPRIAITRPTTGAQFPPETAVEIVAEARDPDGYVPKVEFFADGRKIGERNVVFIRPPEPGQSQTFDFVWRFSSPGSHVLTARATDNNGATAGSASVEISVATPDLLPVVSVTARDAFAVEPVSNAGLDTASFRIRRFGPTNGVLVVNYSLHGTAENGVDYERLSGLAVIPAGQRSVTVTVRPLADSLTEQMEPVILQLEEPAGEQPSTYRVGQSRRAVAVISDLSMPHAFASAECLLLPDGSRNICFPAQTGQNFRVEASNDLRNWETLCNTPAIDGALHFVDEEAANFPSRFYRLTPEPVAVAEE